MSKYKIGDLLVCLSGEDELPTLGYIADTIGGRHTTTYYVQWSDDIEGDTWEYKEETINTYHQLFLEQTNEI